MRKTLLVAGSVPGTGHVGEIILRDLVRHAGASNFSCVGVVPPKYQWRADESLAGLPVTLLRTRNAGARRWSNAAWGAAGSVLNHLTALKLERNSLVARVVEEGRRSGAEQVFAILNNPMMFGLAHRVASALSLPMSTLVWDPPEYLLSSGRFDRWSRKALMSDFNRSLAASSRVAVVSETMQADYAGRAGGPVQLLRHGLPVPDASAPERRHRDEWLIGFAGAMYSNCAWNAFIAALDAVDWRIACKPVRLRVLSARATVASRSRARVEFLGFRPPAEVQALLAECDACYLPQPFVSHLRELSRYAFPTKLTNYLSLGIPVLVHAPEYSALAPFLREHGVGVHVPSLEAGVIAGALQEFFADEGARREMGATGQATAASLFSDRSFHAAIDQFLGARIASP